MPTHTSLPKSEPAHFEQLAYRVDDAARASGLSRSTLHELIGTGALPSVKIAGRRLILVDDLRQLLAVAKGMPDPQPPHPTNRVQASQRAAITGAKTPDPDASEVRSEMSQVTERTRLPARSARAATARALGEAS